jgi:hypothetical protein
MEDGGEEADGDGEEARDAMEDGAEDGGSIRLSTRSDLYEDLNIINSKGDVYLIDFRAIKSIFL